MVKRIRMLVAVAVGAVFLVLPGGAAAAATPTDIFILGGDAAVSEQVAAQLTACTTGNVIRLSGNNRYATAAAISAQAFDPGVPVVTIATGLNFPDALAGGAAAGATGGPVLLVTKDTIPAATAQELTRLRPGEIVILGGTGAVSDSVQTALGAFTFGGVSRISGSDRYATAAATSAATFTSSVTTAWVATGTNFPDALAGGPPAIVSGGPVLLVKPNAIPASIQNELTRLNLTTINILGGPGAVSASVQSQLGAFASGTVDRLFGSNRFATAANTSRSSYAPGVAAIFVATGENFPDALAGGPAAAKKGGPLLLVQQNALPVATAAEISRLTGISCDSTVPTPPLDFTTARDILDGKIPVGDDVVMRGEAIRRIDQDDYQFADRTGEIRIDIQDGLNQDVPLFTCIVIAGAWGGTELAVDAYAGCAILGVDLP